MEHRDWLRKKLREYKITEQYLLGLTIIVERTIYYEQLRMNKSASRPFYMLRKEGKPTKAWGYIAELALFCKHRDYNPAEYVRSLCSIPYIRRKLFYDKDQVPISILSPSTKNGASQLRRHEDHYLRQHTRH
jgi:hypothetical protein